MKHRHQQRKEKTGRFHTLANFFQNLGHSTRTREPPPPGSAHLPPIDSASPRQTPQPPPPPPPRIDPAPPESRLPIELENSLRLLEFDRVAYDLPALAAQPGLIRSPFHAMTHHKGAGPTSAVDEPLTTRDDALPTGGGGDVLPAPSITYTEFRFRNSYRNTRIYNLIVMSHSFR